jgi:uncharacterized protein
MTIHSLATLRTVALTTQTLHTANGNEIPPTRERLSQVIEQIGCVQIDTLHVVRRSHYLVPWSRLGSYDPADLDALASGPERRLFEGWQHAACLIPLAEYRFQMPHQRNLREHPTNWYNRWLSENVHQELVPQVLERIRREGALKVSDFERGEHPAGAWWNWRPAKVALEYLYSFGELMITGRDKFQRLYDLTERVLPEWVDTHEPSVEERDRFWVERGAKALGICLVRHPGDYTWMKVTKSRPIVADLVREGILLPISGRLADGSAGELLIHRDNLPLLEQAADGSLKAQRTTFLSPFDNFWWAARRDELLWGFHQSLECYIPAPKRVYGYFSLAILHKDSLVGRFDPKLERKTGLLRLKAFHLEPGIKPQAELVSDVAVAMRDFMNFHQAKELVIETSTAEEFTRKLMRKI